ncbi:MAG: histidinol-phosphate transaminase [Anaerolineae bacterium]
MMSANKSLWSFFDARLDAVKEYAPEPLEATAKRLGVPVEGLIKLDANENPYGPTPAALDTVRRYRALHRYPDPLARDLREAIGEFVGADPSTIVVGNGSDELIELILRLVRPDASGGGVREILTCPPTFGMYAFYGSCDGIPVCEVPRVAPFEVDVDAIERICGADPRLRVLFLASPNNPDGSLLSTLQLERLLALPLMIVLDEAYVEFGGESRAGMVAEHDNLVVLRTFSKWAGLAGMRIGYGVCPPRLAELMLKQKSPYNVNGPAQAAALATLQDRGAALEWVNAIVAERERMRETLGRLAFLQPYPSHANFLLCRLEGVEAEALRVHMESRGILLRYFGEGRLRDHVRISVGTPAQNDAVLAALREL